jgi:hypothetical protein
LPQVTLVKPWPSYSHLDPFRDKGTDQLYERYDLDERRIGAVAADLRGPVAHPAQIQGENAGQQNLLVKQQDQLRVIRKKLYRVSKELQAANKTAESANNAHQELAKKNSAIQATTPARIRRHLALADTDLSKRIAASANQREKLELQEKRDAIRTIMQLMISSRLEQELASAAQSYATSDRKETLVRRRVNEMFPKVLSQPYKKPASNTG